MLVGCDEHAQYTKVQRIVASSPAEMTRTRINYVRVSLWVQGTAEFPALLAWRWGGATGWGWAQLGCSKTVKTKKTFTLTLTITLSLAPRSLPASPSLAHPP